MSTQPLPLFPPLPIDEALPALLAALSNGPNATLQAPPGAGKTTRVPLALLDQPWRGDGRIIMLEPRRLAARGAARRMAAMLGEEVGGTVGYRVRLDSRVSARTRIEVVTEGIFLRQLQSDASLDGVAAVLFDEFHERSLDADLALAFCLQSQALLRDNLRLLVMSATLDGGPVAGLLGGAPLITSEGRAHPVETRWAEPNGGERMEDATARTIRRALAEEMGSLLVFLPGSGEIRRVERLLGEGRLPADVMLTPLYGDLSLEAQDAAIRPAPDGKRKVVLATSIAETSLTIEGVRVVIDSGLSRLARFDPRSGMGRLETVRSSRASADQRRGRAGRTAPGICYRLWSEAADRALAAFTPPEIARADLAPLALELAQWGIHDAAELAWLDQPPAPSLSQARELLRQLGALDDGNRITRHGQAMAGLGLHPRLAHLVLRGRELGRTRLACRVAALIGERDILRGGSGMRDADLRTRLDHLAERGRGGEVDRGALHQALDSARQLERQVGGPPGDMDHDGAGLLLALAYPDRIAQRRPGSPGQYRLSGGRGAALDPTDALASRDWLAVADLDGQGRDARVFLAAPVTQAELEEAFAGDIVAETLVEWDGREQAVKARRRRRLFALSLKEELLQNPPAEAVMPALLQGIREMGLACLPWSKELESWRTRVAFLHRAAPERWPDMSDTALLATLEDWLAPYLAGVMRRSHLDRIDLHAALTGLLDWNSQQALNAEAPTHLTVPTGNRIPIDYTGEEPVLAVRLQELFGLAETPRLGGGRVPVLLHLLSPAHRPVQVTRDLAGFWKGSYREVKKDLAGRYPRHYWPDDPLEAEPTARAKRRGT
ncbi:ATP-dependent helicase HrpB [Niveispirillum sp. SYP-B3756]|uniref:ATP-dependent helicase HrpB n=1 Tax=Niveispirillum sp. SYP-B3756 TaxID=2662178 RepID=UPI0012921EED|nr:ATP-dependent helicase HrpB [Niveispirillum sp. SYP-B3756]MQP66303.1 ATP-dependent helicase HrpB [Niveispirillum sp. SYP-B3756]